MGANLCPLLFQKGMEDMILKKLEVSEDLKLFRELSLRMQLSDAENQYLSNMEKGYEGEQAFSNMLEKRSDDWLIINDLLLEHNNTRFQIDTLLLQHNGIYLFEVKNYEGDFYIEADKWHNKSGKEMKNPILQLTRSESLLRQLFQELRINIPIKAYVVFINPEFTLYQAPRDLPVIFPSQLNRFLEQLKNSSVKLNKKYLSFAEKLISLHQADNPYARVPEYDYERVGRGITCEVCSSFITSIKGDYIVCDVCGDKELIDTAVIRNVYIFKRLFPNHKVTTNTIYEWCHIIPSNKTIRRILSRNFIRKGQGKYSYYVDC